jgi:hypothetical protein
MSLHERCMEIPVGAVQVGDVVNSAWEQTGR